MNHHSGSVSSIFVQYFKFLWIVSMPNMQFRSVKDLLQSYSEFELFGAAAKHPIDNVMQYFYMNVFIFTKVYNLKISEQPLQESAHLRFLKNG